MTTTAFNYEKQVWVTGDDAKSVRITQIKSELELLRSDRGARYLAFTGSPQTMPGIIRALESELAKLV